MKLMPKLIIACYLLILLPFPSTMAKTDKKEEVIKTKQKELVLKSLALGMSAKDIKTVYPGLNFAPVKKENLLLRYQVNDPEGLFWLTPAKEYIMPYLNQKEELVTLVNVNQVSNDELPKILDQLLKTYGKTLILRTHSKKNKVPDNFLKKTPSGMDMKLIFSEEYYATACWGACEQAFNQEGFGSLEKGTYLVATLIKEPCCQVKLELSDQSRMREMNAEIQNQLLEQMKHEKGIKIELPPKDAQSATPTKP